VDTVISAVKPLLVGAGFRKRARTFERRRGDVTQLVNVQRSHGGNSFYVNVGLVFDAISDLRANQTGLLVLGKDIVHFGARLHELVTDLPERWTDDDADADEQVRNALEVIVAKFDRIDGPVAMLNEFPLDAGFQKVLRAQLKWISGDTSGARADLEAVASELSDRRGCDVGKLAARAGIQV
jgi:hypothetical protein